MLLVIFVNFGLLCAHDPTLPKGEGRNKISGATADLVFNVIYTLEMVLRMVTLGLGAYLRRGWYVLDMFVVVFGWVTFGLGRGGSGVAGLRMLRILRLLKTIPGLGGMRVLVQSLLKALPNLTNVFALFGFILVLFGITAVQLWAGQLRRRCVDDLTGLEIDPLWSDRPNPTRLCSVSTGRRCPAGSSCLQIFQNPNWGVTSFDNILSAMLMVFQVMTLEGWSVIMYWLQDGASPYVWLYFLVLILFATYFVLNLAIAVIFSQFSIVSNAAETRATRKKAISEVHTALAAKLTEIERVIEQDTADDGGSRASMRRGTLFADSIVTEDIRRATRGVEDGKKKKVEEQEPKKEEEEEEVKRPPSLALRVVDHPIFVRGMMGVILANTLVLASVFYGQPDYWTRAVSNLNLAFMVIFLAELVLKVVGMGPRAWWRDRFNIFDLLVVLGSVVELMVDLVTPGSSSRGVSALRAFRLLRVFKLARTWESLRLILEVTMASIGLLGNCALLMLLFMGVFSVIGMDVFGGKFRFADMDPAVPRSNFDSFPWSMVTVFTLMTGESWNDVLVTGMRVAHWTSAFYFIAIVIIGNYVIVNMFQVVLLQKFSQFSQEREEKGGSKDSGAVVAVESASAADGDRVRKLARILNLNRMIKDEEEEDKGGARAELIRFADHHSDDYTYSYEDENISSSKEGEGDYEYVYEYEDDGGYSRDGYASGSASSGSAGSAGSAGSSMDEEALAALAALRRAVASGRVVLPDGVTAEEATLESSDGTAAPIALATTNASGPDDAPASSPWVSETWAEKRARKIASLQGRALLVLGPTNRFRVGMARVVFHPLFEYAVLAVIVFSSVLLALDRPTLKDGDALLVFLRRADLVLTGLFLCEFAAKVLVLGFAFGRGTYLRNGWNVIDFLVIVVALLGLLPNFRVKWVRALRTLRPLRFISRFSGMKVVVHSIVKSIPSIFNVLMVCVLFWVIYGILGVQFFGGALYSCAMSAAPFDPLPDVATRAECLAAGQRWVRDRRNFDNILYAMLVLFEVGTQENWPAIMYRAVDAVSYDVAPRRDANRAATLYFMSFVVVGAFFAVNLFVGVVIDHFGLMKDHFNGSALLTRAQRDWVDLQRMMTRYRPFRVVDPPKRGSLQRSVYNFVTHRYFEGFLVACIVLNIVSLMVTHYNQGPTVTRALEGTNIVFVAVFTAEALLKLVGMGPRRYLRDRWNVFDLFVVVISVVGLGYRIGFAGTAFRALRVFRVFKLVKWAKGINTLLLTLFYSIPTLSNVGSLLLLVFFVYAVAGVGLFGRVRRDGSNLDDHTNFETFPRAMLSLFRCVTGESWNEIMYSLAVQPPLCDPSAAVDDCGTKLSYIYFVTFQTVVYFVLVNLFVAVILESFNELTSTGAEDQVKDTLTADSFADFSRAWSRLDPAGTHYLPSAELQRLLVTVPAPLGLGPGAPRARVVMAMLSLNVPVYDGMVFYKDVVIALARRHMGTEVPRVKVVDDLERRWPKHRKDLRGREPEYSVRQWEAVVRIQRRWREYAAARREGRERARAVVEQRLRAEKIDRVRVRLADRRRSVFLHKVLLAEGEEGEVSE